MTDRTHIRSDTGKLAYLPTGNGVEAASLFADEHEDVRMERWAPGTPVPLDALNGLEALVIEGEFEDAGETFTTQSWLRLPKGGSGLAKAGPAGATVWIKRNHLAKAPTAPTT